MREERRRRPIAGEGGPSAGDSRRDRDPRSAGAPGADPIAGSGGLLTIRTPAKINLGLRVLGRRPDGYHRIRTRLAAVALWDTLTLEPGGSGVRLEVTGPEASGIPAGPENLVLRAAERIERVRRRRAGPGESLPGVRLRLWKEIPAGRGLGGGSSDAAATLVGLDRLFGLGLSRAALHRMAAAIGMDVPYFLYGGPALAAGRGDAVFPLREPPGNAPPDSSPDRSSDRSSDRSCDWALVLLLPAYGIGTADAYRGLPPPFRSSNAPSADAAPTGRIAAPSGGFGGRGDLREARSFPFPLHDLRNDLEQSAVLETLPSGPTVPELRRALEAEGAFVSALSGSGSAVFGLFGSPAAAERAARKLDRRPDRRFPGGDCRALATRTVSRAEQRAARSGVSP